MAKVNVYNVTGEKVNEIDLNPAVFGITVKPELITQVVVAQQANARQVLAHTKDKSEVRGGGRKPWRQKKTGRARHGSIRSPLWRGGGITFGPTNERNFSLKVNKRVKRQALLMTLSDKASNQKIILLDQLELAETKTKKFFEILRSLELRPRKLKKTGPKTEKAEKGKNTKSKVKSILLVLPKKDEKIYRSSRNIDRLTPIQANSLNVVDVLKHQYILMPVNALSVIEKTFAK